MIVSVFDSITASTTGLDGNFSNTFSLRDEVINSSSEEGEDIAGASLLNLIVRVNDCWCVGEMTMNAFVAVMLKMLMKLNRYIVNNVVSVASTRLDDDDFDDEHDIGKSDCFILFSS